MIPNISHFSVESGTSAPSKNSRCLRAVIPTVKNSFWISVLPIYRFTAVQGDNACPDVRWAHLKDEEAARHYAKLLIQEFFAKGRYTDLTHWRLEVKDQIGELLLSIPLQERVA